MGPSPIWFLLAMVPPTVVSLPEWNIDLVLIPHMNAMHFGPEFNAIKTAAMAIFPTVFSFGPGKSRVGLVYNGLKGSGPDREWKLTTLFDNEADLKAFLDPIHDYPSNVLHERALGKALVLAREIFDSGTPSQNIRVILLATYPVREPLEIEDGDKAAFEEARNEGIHTYAVYQLKPGDPQHDVLLASVTGSTSNIYTTEFEGGLNKTVFDWLKNKLIGVSFCGYIQECFFQDPERKECKSAPYTPNVTVDDGDCAANFDAPMPTATNRECDVNMCNTTCDHLWGPITDVKCGENDCGKTLRSQTPKRWTQLQYCDRELKCPACTTTNQPAVSITTSQPAANNPTTTEPDDDPTEAGMRVQVAMALIIAGAVIAMIGGF